MKTVTRKRLVRIDDMGYFWAVAYVDRKKGQHYWAAQFDKKVRDYDYVARWIGTHPRISLFPD